MPKEAKEIPMLFCHIAWMEEYRGTANDTPLGGGSHPEKEEHLNFFEFDGYMYGYVPTPTRTIDVKKLRIDEAENTDQTDLAESARGVTVIWTATRPGGGRVIVGWYREAMVFRELEDRPGRGWYNVKAAAEHCVLIKPNRRRFEVERAKSGRRGRPGQAGVWYLDSRYGKAVRGRVSDLLSSQEFDGEQLNIRTAELATSIRLDAPPRGVTEPISQNRKVTVWGRDPEVRAYAIKRAHGKCEYCHRAPFNTPNGEPFLEVHHVKQLADGGPDTVDNAVALCPNCHREAHFGTEKDAITKKLRNVLRKTRL